MDYPDGGAGRDEGEANAETVPPDLRDELGQGILETRALRFFYGRRLALDGVSLRIPPRRITAVIGPSGCGKSTFIRCFNRMNDGFPGARAEGEVLVEGVDVNRGGLRLEELRRKVGMVFQRSNPFPTSIFDNVIFGPSLRHRLNRSEREEIVEKALRRADLWKEVRDRLSENAASLSGGEQQRLCIARALANEPEILLMDEPAGALDPLSTGRIEQLLLSLRERYTVVLVTHNMQQAGRVADYTAFFMGGRLVEMNLTERLFRLPFRDLTEKYITGRFG